MVIVEVVLETYDAVGFTTWPIATPSSDRYLALSGQLSTAEVGTAMAVILTYNTLTELTRARLAEHLAEAEALTAPGGLRFRDTCTNAVVAPGCCFGLESWRDWQDVMTGQDLWLGHDPDTRLEHTGQHVRLSQGDQGPAVQIDLNELPGLLASAQQQLSGFLELARHWTTSTAPQLAVPLVAALDEHLKINQPL